MVAYGIAELQASKEGLHAHVADLGQQLEDQSKASASLQKHVTSLQDEAVSMRHQHAQSSKAQQAELQQKQEKMDELHRDAAQTSEQHAQQLADHRSQIDHLQDQVCVHYHECTYNCVLTAIPYRQGCFPRNMWTFYPSCHCHPSMISNMQPADMQEQTSRQASSPCIVQVTIFSTQPA